MKKPMIMIGVLALSGLTTCFAAEGKTPFWHDSENLAKALVLGNMITRMTDDDGLESIWWNEKDRRKDIWPNCMFACEAA